MDEKICYEYAIFCYICYEYMLYLLVSVIVNCIFFLKISLQLSWQPSFVAILWVAVMLSPTQVYLNLLKNMVKAQFLQIELQATALQCTFSSVR